MVADVLNKSKKAVKINVATAYMQNAKVGPILVFAQAVVYVKMGEIVHQVSIIGVVNQVKLLVKVCHFGVKGEFNIWIMLLQGAKVSHGGGDTAHYVFHG